MMCSVTKSSVIPLLRYRYFCSRHRYSMTVTFPIPLQLPLLCYRVTEHITDDGSMGHGLRKVTHGPLWVKLFEITFWIWHVGVRFPVYVLHLDIQFWPETIVGRCFLFLFRLYLPSHSIRPKYVHTKHCPTIGSNWLIWWRCLP